MGHTNHDLHGPLLFSIATSSTISSRSARTTECKLNSDRQKVLVTGIVRAVQPYPVTGGSRWLYNLIEVYYSAVQLYVNSIATDKRYCSENYAVHRRAVHSAKGTAHSSNCVVAPRGLYYYQYCIL